MSDRAIFLDIGGVVIDIIKSVDTRRSDYEELVAISFPGCSPRALLQIGMLTPEDFIATVGKASAGRYSETEIRDLECSSLGPVKQEIVSLIAALEPVDIIVASNTNAIHWERIRTLVQTSVSPRGYMLSFELGCAKPDGRYFHIMHERASRYRKHLFLDDSADNVRAATELAIESLQVTDGLSLEMIELALDAH